MSWGPDGTWIAEDEGDDETPAQRAAKSRAPLAVDPQKAGRDVREENLQRQPRFGSSREMRLNQVPGYTPGKGWQAPQNVSSGLSDPGAWHQAFNGRPGTEAFSSYHLPTVAPAVAPAMNEPVSPGISAVPPAAPVGMPTFMPGDFHGVAGQVGMLPKNQYGTGWSFVPNAGQPLLPKPSVTQAAPVTTPRLSAVPS